MIVNNLNTFSSASKMVWSRRRRKRTVSDFWMAEKVSYEKKNVVIKELF